MSVLLILSVHNSKPHVMHLRAEESRKRREREKEGKWFSGEIVGEQVLTLQKGKGGDAARIKPQAGSVVGRV